jgi:hypothetical protein
MIRYIREYTYDDEPEGELQKSMYFCRPVYLDFGELSQVIVYDGKPIHKIASTRTVWRTHNMCKNTSVLYTYNTQSVHSMDRRQTNKCRPNSHHKHGQCYTMQSHSVIANYTQECCKILREVEIVFSLERENPLLKSHHQEDDLLFNSPPRMVEIKQERSCNLAFIIER